MTHKYFILLRFLLIVASNLSFSSALNWNKEDYEWTWIEITNTNDNKTVSTRSNTDGIAVNNMIYIYGGAGTDPKFQSLGDLEVYNVEFNSWNNLTVANVTKPMDRLSHASTYIPDRNSIVIFGGVGQNGTWNYLIPLNDTWEYFLENGTWRELQGVDGSQIMPTTADTTIVYDSDRKVLIVCGGVDSRPTNQTWEFSFETYQWHLITNATGFSPREDHGAVYLPYDKSVYVFGGSCSMREFNYCMLGDFLRYNTTTKAWTQLNVPDGPPPLTSHLMQVWDDDTFILHGGCHNMTITQSYSPYCDIFSTKTYLFNARLQKWTVISDLENTVNPIRYSHAGAVVKKSKEDNPSLIMFGGISTPTRQLDGSMWKLEVRPKEPKGVQSWLILFPVVGGFMFVLSLISVFVVLRRNMLQTGVWVFS